jgi:membrane protein YdbS with pleckstrin-like domain
MFCPNCGKQIKEDDNFCRYCGTDLRLESNDKSVEQIVEEVVKENKTDNEKIIVEVKKTEEQKQPIYTGEELVLYDIKKHWMALFWPAFLTPLFLVYFWVIFLNTHSFFSWIIVIAMLFLIIYPIARYKSDKIIITTKSAHIKIGVLNPAEIEIPLEKLNIIDVSQSSMGRLLDYGTATFCINAEKYDYSYIKYPEDLQFIIDEPQKFIEESLREN